MRSRFPHELRDATCLFFDGVLTPNCDDARRYHFRPDRGESAARSKTRRHPAVPPVIRCDPLSNAPASEQIHDREQDYCADEGDQERRKSHAFIDRSNADQR